MFLCLMLIVVNRKTIPVKRKVALYVCFGAQAAGIGLQAFNLGISFSQIGTAIGMVILVTSYLLEWIKHEREDEEAYYLDIALVNEEGLIQVDTDRDRIENDYYDLTGISQMTSDVLYQRIDSKGTTSVR